MRRGAIHAPPMTHQGKANLSLALQLVAVGAIVSVIGSAWSFWRLREEL